MFQLDWNATIDSIRELLPQTQFINWIKPVELLRCDESSVVLGVPSRFHEEWLRSHYTEQFNQAIREQCGTQLQLEFEILVKRENQQASEGSPTAPPPIALSSGPSVVAARALRIVEAPPFADEEAPQPSEPSNIPAFHHPFFERRFNQVASQCAVMFAQLRDNQINPLIIQSTVGMGKTHLLSEIARRMKEQNPRARIRYTNAEAFTSELVMHLKTKSDAILTFKRKYAEATDCLLFDDIQGLTNRLKIQESLLHIFNEILTRGGKVAFATSVSPHRLEGFIDPLKSRILSGVIAEVNAPTFDEKVSLLAAMCEHNRLLLDPLVLRSLADKGQKDIRELLGTLFRLHLQAKLENRTLDTEFLARAGWVQEVRKETITMDEIVSLVEHNLGVSRADLCSKSRKGAITWGRQVAMFLARHHTMLSLQQIGKTFDRDHATVVHAFTKVKETMESQPTRRYEVEYLREKLQSRSPRGHDVPSL